MRHCLRSAAGLRRSAPTRFFCKDFGRVAELRFAASTTGRALLPTTSSPFSRRTYPKLPLCGTLAGQPRSGEAWRNTRRLTDRRPDSAAKHRRPGHRVAPTCDYIGAWGLGNPEAAAHDECCAAVPQSLSSPGKFAKVDCRTVDAVGLDAGCPEGALEEPIGWKSVRNSSPQSDLHRVAGDDRRLHPGGRGGSAADFLRLGSGVRAAAR